MDFILGLIVGVIVGAVFAPVLIKLWKWGYAKITKNVDDLD